MFSINFGGGQKFPPKRKTKINLKENDMIYIPEPNNIPPPPPPPELKPLVGFINESGVIGGNFTAPTTSSIEINKDAILGENFNEQIYKMILSRLSARPIIQHKCHNCGGTVELDENKHIFICPYCDAHYAVGTCCGINDKGD